MIYGFVEAYIETCNEEKVTPIPFLVETMKKAEQGEDIRGIVLRGNSKQLFNNRLGDAHVAVLSNVLADGKFPQIEELDLSYNGITDEGAAKLADLIATTAAIRRLVLTGNELTGAGMTCLADALPDSGVVELIVRENDVGDSGVMALARNLRSTPRLEVLDVSYTDMGIRGLLSLLEPLLEGSPQLRSLKIENPRIKGSTREAFTYIARLCTSHLTLEELSLAKTFMDDAAFEMLIASGLTKNQSIRSLSLRGNMISESSADALARLMHENQSIADLDLSGNRIGDEVAIALAETIPAHPAIEALDLTGNRVGDLGLAALAASLLQPPSLRSLKAWGNDFARNSSEAFFLLASEVPSIELDVRPFVVDGVYQVAKL